MIYHGQARQSWGYGAYQNYDCVVIADTKSEALGLALMEYPDTSAVDWDFEVIENKNGVTQISSRGT